MLFICGCLICAPDDNIVPSVLPVTSAQLDTRGTTLLGIMYAAFNSKNLYCKLEFWHIENKIPRREIVPFNSTKSKFV